MESNLKKVKLQRQKKKPKNLKLVGYHGQGKIFYPTAINRDRREWKDYLIHGFLIKTKFLPVVSQAQISRKLNFFIWNYTNADTYQEYLGLQLEAEEDIPIFVSKEKTREVMFEDERWVVYDQPAVKVEVPRKVIVPKPKVFDSYNLDITLFTKNNYLAIPVCIATITKENISEGWIYAYPTVIDGVEGIYIEANSETPFSFRGQVIRV